MPDLCNQYLVHILHSWYHDLFVKELLHQPSHLQHYYYTMLQQLHFDFLRSHNTMTPLQFHYQQEQHFVKPLLQLAHSVLVHLDSLFQEPSVKTFQFYQQRIALLMQFLIILIYQLQNKELKLQNLVLDKNVRIMLQD